MINPLMDLYTDYLIASFSKVTATGLSETLDGTYSHDQISRLLTLHSHDSRDYWRAIKSTVRRVERDDGIIVVDDTIEDKPYTDENEIICWHFDHTKGQAVKGVNIVNFLYHVDQTDGNDVSIPVAYEIVHKTESYLDSKTGKTKRRSTITKNEMVRSRLQVLLQTNRIKCRHVTFDVWFSSKENIKYIKLDLKKDVVCAIKSNRTAALSMEDKLAGRFVSVSTIDLAPGETRMVYLKGIEFPVVFTTQVFTNEDGSTGIRYLISTDTTLNYDQIITIYQRRWKVEVFHKSLKQNAGLEKSPTKTVTTQKNHIFAAMLAFVKLEMLKINHLLNHFALKSKLYIKALKASFDELNSLKTKINSI